MYLYFNNSEYWGYCFEDMLTCIARLPRIAALIYR